MNGKKAKQLRRKANLLMNAFIATRVLTEEQLAAASTEQLNKVLPRSMLLRKDGVCRQAFGTVRFFIRVVKKRPDIMYEELDAAVYGNANP